MKTYTLLSLIVVSSFVSTGYNTPLTIAIMNSDILETTRLLNNDADPNKRNSNSYTPLFYALHSLPSIFTKRLLEHGADPNAYSHTSKTWKVLDRAIIFGNKEHVNLLLEHGADPFQVGMENLDLMKLSKTAKLVQAKRRKQRLVTLLLCTKEIPIDLPAKIVVMIKDNMKDIVKPREIK